MGIRPNTEGYRSHEREAEVVQSEICRMRRNPSEVRWKTLNEDDKDKFWEGVETEWEDVVAFQAVAIIPLEVVRDFRLNGLVSEGNTQRTCCKQLPHSRSGISCGI